MIGRLMASTLMKAFAMAGTLVIALVVGTALAQTRTPTSPVREKVSEARITSSPAATTEHVRVDPNSNEDVRVYTTESYNPDTGERTIETQVIAGETDAANPFARPGFMEHAAPKPSESDQQIGRLLRELRGRPGEPRDERKLAELRELVNRQFEERHAAQMQRLERVMDDVRRTQEILERRAHQRDEIVERRVAELLGQPDPMQWDYQPGGLPRPATAQSLGNARSRDDASAAETGWIPGGDAQNIPPGIRRPSRSFDGQSVPRQSAARQTPPTPVQPPTPPTAPAAAPLRAPANPDASGAEPSLSNAVNRIPADLLSSLDQLRSLEEQLAKVESLPDLEAIIASALEEHKVDRVGQPSELNSVQVTFPSVRVELRQARRALEQAAQAMAEAAQSTAKADDQVSKAKLRRAFQLKELALKQARQELAAAEEQFQLVEKFAEQMEPADVEREIVEVEHEEANAGEKENQAQADDAIEIEEEQVQEHK